MTIELDSRDFNAEKLALMLYDGVFSRTACLSRADARILAEVMIHCTLTGHVHGLCDLDREMLVKAIYDGQFTNGMHEYSWGTADEIAERMLSRARGVWH
jgi:hypothetical protein